MAGLSPAADDVFRTLQLASHFGVAQ